MRLGGKSVAPTVIERSAISRLFSSAVFREMAKKGRSGAFPHLYRLSGLGDLGRAATVKDGFESAFEVLRRTGSRDEYVYRAAVTEKVLLGKHSLKTASMLTEFRAGNCKADLVILNGTATAFEIKSERDSLARLSNQIVNYNKVFAAINVIVSEDHLEAVIRAVPEDVGVMCLGHRYRIRTIREAKPRPEKTCPVTIFDSLQVDEARRVLRMLGVAVPDTPNTQLRGAMRLLFSQLDPQDVHSAMVSTLKRTRDLAPLKDLVERLPKSLRAAALSIPVRRAEHDRLLAAVSTRLSDAMAWT
jgi:hypothetical protein